MMLARPSNIAFRISWKDSVDGVECKTLASIALVVNNTPIWPVKGEIAEDFEWFADELLAHLVEGWKPLVLRQTYPIPVRPERPSLLTAETERRWSTVPKANVELEQERIAAFEDVHNLANAFGGVSGLLPLWFLRAQDEMVVDTQEMFLRLPLRSVVDALSCAGDEIARRLQEANPRKWGRLIDAWRDRDKGDGATILAFAIGRDRDSAAELIAGEVLQAPTSVSEAANDNDELRIAARMAGAIPIHQVKSVIEQIRTCKLRRAPMLEELANAALEFVSSDELFEARPYVQGNELALWLRRTLNLSPRRSLDPISILERSLNVDVRAIDFQIPSLDAVAVWGPKYGPGVLLNRTSGRIRASSDIWKNGALRVTAAHELCHLLLDSKHPLSAVDVLGGQMPARVEQRAKAFAAELLLPSDEAADVWRSEGYPLELDRLRQIIRHLCKIHKVTESVAAWQLQHGASAVHWDDLDIALDQLVPHR